MRKGLRERHIPCNGREMSVVVQDDGNDVIGLVQSSTQQGAESAAEAIEVLNVVFQLESVKYSIQICNTMVMSQVI